MGWTQDYSIESLQELLEKLTGKTAESSLTEVLESQGLKIVKMEQFVLEDDMYVGEIKGLRIELSDGRVFVHKLTRVVQADGNYGCDTYDLVLESETPKVEQIYTENGKEIVEGEPEHNYVDPDNNCCADCGRCACSGNCLDQIR